MIGFKKSIKQQYYDLLKEFKLFKDEDTILKYAETLAYRHKNGRAIPTSVYKKYSNFLYYKKSLGRTSPYYVDLLKLDDPVVLKSVLRDLCRNMVIKEDKTKESTIDNEEYPKNYSKKLFVSIPMNGRKEEDIKKSMLEAKKSVEETIGESVELLDTLFKFDTNNPLIYLAESIKKMAEADIVYMCDGWHDARGCLIEQEIAYRYNKTLQYEPRAALKKFIKPSSRR